ncbi:MAG TPA: TetR/AcrR family transcriptional regulator [Kofleriaceae bacterium]|nr:TetR/AcrR family transcriptional regulator [Kofleriaceae bacterium]
MRGEARTAKGEKSRKKLIEATAALLRKQGFHATGLSEIVEESGAPRGSLYFYFPGGKEELACAALEESGAMWRQLLDGVVGAAPDLGAAVERVCGVLAEALAASGWESGCPLATVALEASAHSEKVRQTCASHYTAWEEIIAERLHGLGIAHAEARRVATFGLAAIEGALLLAKVQRDPAPLHTTGRMLRELLAQHVTK